MRCVFQCKGGPIHGYLGEGEVVGKAQRVCTPGLLLAKVTIWKLSKAPPFTYSCIPEELNTNKVTDQWPHLCTL